jgi:hypothetical protein
LTKEKFVALVVDYLAGGTCPADLMGKYHPLVIEEYLSLVYGEILYQVNANAIDYRDFGQLDSYVKAYKDVAVLYDAERDEHYSILPASVVQFPKNRGIRSISPLQDQRAKFWYSDNNTDDVYSELEVGKIIDRTRYYVENNRVYYRNYDHNITSLLFKLVVPFSEFSDEDNIAIPAQQNAQVFNMIVNLLRQKVAEKNTNDNHSKTQV